MMRKLLLIAAAAAALATHLSANAASSAHASVDHLTLTLFDLNLTDGIAPSISFAAGSSGAHGSSASTSASDAATGSRNGQTWSMTAFGPVASSSNAGGAAATASLSGSVFGSGMHMLAAGSAGGASVPGFGTDFNAQVLAGEYYDGVRFTLSANTLLVFSGTASLFAQTTFGSDANGNSEESFASAGLWLRGPGAGGQGNQESATAYDVRAGTDYSYDPDTGDFIYSGQTISLADAALVASFVNYTGASLVGTMGIAAGVNGSSLITAVPEPESTALLLAGLATLGLVTRRRRPR